MSVQFILGKSGTGKTNLCASSIIDELVNGSADTPLILLVPEQATYQAERAILSDQRISGFSRLSVLSFDRLSYLLAARSTVGIELSRTAQQMIVQRVLLNCHSRLNILQKAAADSNRSGLASGLVDTIIELHQSAKTVEEVNNFAQTLIESDPDRLTALKFKDIATIFAEYLDFIEPRFTNPDIHLTIALKTVPDANFLKGAKLWVDGFATFTVQQRRLLAELLKTASDSKIALCLDPTAIDPVNPSADEISPTSLFNLTERSFAELIEMVRKCKLKLDTPLILSKAFRFSESPDMAHIERHLYQDLQPPKINATGQVTIVRAPNSRSEADFTARKIIQLVRKQNLRFRDIAVVVSDITEYQHYITAAFQDHQIPFFIDRRKPLKQHPVVDVIVSALRTIERNFNTSDVFAYLKSGAVPIERSQVDILENYCIAYGIDSRDWLKKNLWKFAGKDDSVDENLINDIRRRVCEPLQKFKENIHTTTSQISATTFVRAVYDFLETLNVRQTLADMSQTHPDRQNENHQLYAKLMDIFDELVDVFAEESVSTEELIAIVLASLSDMTLAFIPPMLDQVLVGTVERSRHPDLKAVFLLGATQKQFPVPVSFGGILTEADRLAALAQDFELSDPLAQQLAGRQYLAYIALTRASDHMFITYPLTDSDGKELIPSSTIDRLKNLFHDLNEHHSSEFMTGLKDISTPDILADILCGVLGEDSKAPENIRNNFAAVTAQLDRDKTSGAKAVSIVKEALTYKNKAELSPQFASEHFGESMSCSTTRLSTFAACPYKHFASYVLNLKERKQFSFKVMDLGSFYHDLLDKLYKRLNKQNLDFSTADEDQLQELLNEIAADFFENDPAISNFMTRSSHNSHVINSALEVLSDCVTALSEIAKAGTFYQVGSETWFGKDSDNQYTLTASDGKKISLHGIIDRIDTTKKDGKDIAVVFDYKRGPRSVSWANLYHGLDMQLPIYMLAIKSLGIAEPAGAFYIPIESGSKSGTIEDTKQTAKFNHKARGVFNGQDSDLLDPAADKWSKYYSFYYGKSGPYGNFAKSDALEPDQFDSILKFVESKAISIASDIMSGRIEVSPYRMKKVSSCEYCSFNSLCRFDWQINDYNVLEHLDKQQVLDITGGTDDR